MRVLKVYNGAVKVEGDHWWNCSKVVKVRGEDRSNDINDTSYNVKENDKLNDNVIRTTSGRVVKKPVRFVQ